MLDATRAAVGAVIKSDPSIPAEEKKGLIALLTQPAKEPAKPASKRLDAGVLTRNQAAKWMGRTARYIDLLAKSGFLRKVKMPNRKRAVGILASDLEALIAGSATAV